MASLLQKLGALNPFATSAKRRGGGDGGVSVHASARGCLAPLHAALAQPPVSPDASRVIERRDLHFPWLSPQESEGVLAFTLDGVLSRAECAEFIRLTEAAGFGAALVNTGGGRQKLIQDIRNNTRCMIDDAIVANIIFERIRPFLPAEWATPSRAASVPQSARLVGLNERLRFLKYTKDQKFAPHYDGSYVRDATKENPYPECSYITFQLYLNDGESEESGGGGADQAHSDFNGGSTAFIRPQGGKWDGDVPRDTPDNLVHCHPRAGRVLIFQHHLLHQGSPVLRGTKYCMRTDVMYQPIASGEPVAAAASASSSSSASVGNKAVAAPVAAVAAAASSS